MSRQWCLCQFDSHQCRELRQLRADSAEGIPVLFLWVALLAELGHTLFSLDPWSQIRKQKELPWWSLLPQCHLSSLMIPHEQVRTGETSRWQQRPGRRRGRGSGDRPSALGWGHREDEYYVLIAVPSTSVQNFRNNLKWKFLNNFFKHNR